MKKVLQFLAIGLFALGSFKAAQATSYYVDATSGSDSNSGTATSAPWKSLGKVNSVTFQAGDTINFKRGSLWTGNLQVKNSGTSAAPITYQAYDSGAAPHIQNPGVSYGDCITVNGSWNIIQDFLLSDAHESGVDISVGANHNIVRKNEITATGIGVVTRGQYNLVTENYVHDLTMVVNNTTPSNDYGAVCFWLYAGNNEVSYNRGINCRAPSYDFKYDGGFVEVFNSGDNLYIHHNYAENTNGFFELGANNNGSAQNIRVAYNVIYNVKGSPGLCFNSGSYNINVTGFRFENNTFVSTSGDASTYRVFGCRTDFSGIQVRNNIFYSDIQIANNGNFTHTNNVYYMVNMVNGSGVGYSLGSGEKIGNPLFVNIGARDFTLLPSSPAIDAGINLGYSADFGGNAVPAGSAPDAGAYEFGSASILRPAAPTNLTVR